MAVFTRVTEEEVSAWLKPFGLGSCLRLEGISSGIENTNYFVDTEIGAFVLTIFEKLSVAELPFYLGLMEHLARRGLPCPKPASTDSGALFALLKKKPASIVSRLSGRSNMAPSLQHCRAMGEMTARLHLAAADYPATQANPRGPQWWNKTAPQVMPFLSPDDEAMLKDELKTQFSYRLKPLPRGVVHLDLFRDNVLFQGDSIGGVIDFYFAGADVWLFDLAVVVNDWCTEESGALDLSKVEALTRAYAATRPLEQEECEAWPIMLRAAALRFWLSRLFDLHLPRPSEIIHPHNPARFRDILNQYRQAPQSWTA